MGIGRPGDDEISGGRGDDIIFGREGDDFLKIKTGDRHSFHKCLSPQSTGKSAAAPRDAAAASSTIHIIS